MKIQNKALSDDTIVAPATPVGKGSVGIVRISGSKVRTISKKVVKQALKPRYAHYLSFYGINNNVLDEGIVLFFIAPYSFTGEDVVEFHCHGGPVVLNMLIETIIQLGARMAEPGEFTLRAFLNNKLDLAQAEAIADLIDSNSEQAALGAMRSLQGVFSKKINDLVEKIIQLRILVEGVINFPEDEVEDLTHIQLTDKLVTVIELLNGILSESNKGALLKEGLNIVIAGKPNAGKSSLLNAFIGNEKAIVTDVAGTTRDLLHESVYIDGIPLHIIDTAGLCDSNDQVEKIGIEKALQAISKADFLLWVYDGTVVEENNENIFKILIKFLPAKNKIIKICNKIDLLNKKAGLIIDNNQVVINICAKSGDGIEVLYKHLKACIGLNTTVENVFIARNRHLVALKKTLSYLNNALKYLSAQGIDELLAEDLRHAQKKLGELTGEFSNEDLLEQIFSNFCIGK